MKTCPHCGYDLSDDAVYCTKCGKPVEKIEKQKTEKLTKKQRSKIIKEEIKKQQAPKNNWWTFGLILFFIGLVVFDGVIAMIFNSLDKDYVFVFVLSAILYVMAIVSSIISLLVDYKAKKKNLEPTGNMMVSVGIIMFSLYILLVNIQQVILK